jgi:hypothetical protein
MVAVSLAAAMARLSKDADATFHKTITIWPDAKELAMSRTVSTAYSQTVIRNSDKRPHASVNVSLASIIPLAKLGKRSGTVVLRVKQCRQGFNPPLQVIGSER